MSEPLAKTWSLVVMTKWRPTFMGPLTPVYQVLVRELSFNYSGYGAKVTFVY